MSDETGGVSEYLVIKLDATLEFDMRQRMDRALRLGHMIEHGGRLYYVVSRHYSCPDTSFVYGLLSRKEGPEDFKAMAKEMLDMISWPVSIKRETMEDDSLSRLVGAKVGSGNITEVRSPHRCEKPAGDMDGKLGEGSKWKCICGKSYRLEHLYGGRWAWS